MNDEILAEERIRKMYLFLLDREPDVDGMIYFLQKLKNGTELSGIFKEIIESEESKLIINYNNNCKSVKNKVLSFFQKKPLNRQIVVVDVGAQNLSYEDHIYSPLLKHPFISKVIGFEPLENRLEERKQSEMYFDSVFFDSFIGDGNEHLFHINQPDNTSSLLPFNSRVKSKYIGLDETTVRTELAQTETLDKLLCDYDCIDFLKLDIQGFELTALQNAKKILEKTNVIHCEVSFIEIYKEQAFFAEIDTFLRDAGFQFIDFNHRCHYPLINKSQHISKDQLGWGDAIYFKNEEQLNKPESLMIQSLIALLVYNKFSLAATLAEKYGKLASNNLFGDLFKI